MKTLYIYSDESGVFDKFHHDLFVYAGIICIDQNEDSRIKREYLLAEKRLRQKRDLKGMPELKAFYLKPEYKKKLYRVTDNSWRFAAIIYQDKLSKVDFSNKEGKQRFLDYAYKMALKDALQQMIKNSVIDREESLTIYIKPDEHGNATNGKYKLQESLFEEFKYGMYTSNFNYVQPILPAVERIEINYRDSQYEPLIRASDIIANNVYIKAKTKTIKEIQCDNLCLSFFPWRPADV